MKLKMLGTIVSARPSKNGDKQYAQFVDNDLGGLVNLTFPGDLVLKPGAVVDFEATVQGRVGQYGFSLEVIEISKKGDK